MVVMNPPYSEGRALAHLNAAADMVKPGGRLAAILPAGLLFKDVLKDWSWSGIHQDMFAGTAVSVVRLVAYKPD